MNLLSILSKYKKEDAEQMENESLFSKDDKVGLSAVEKWELEKQTNPEPDYGTWHTRTIVQNISDSLGKTISIHE